MAATVQWGTIKWIFKNMLTTEGGSERTWAHYLMRTVILQMGIDKAEMFNVIFVFKADDGLWDHRCSSWRSATVITINSQKILDLCFSTWVHINPWDFIVFCLFVCFVCVCAEFDSRDPMAFQRDRREQHHRLHCCCSACHE